MASQQELLKELAKRELETRQTGGQQQQMAAPAQAPSEFVPIPEPRGLSVPAESPEVGDIPAFLSAGGDFGQAAQIAAGFFVEPSTEGRANILREALPDADVFTDSFGNVGVTMNGQTFQLNRPGLSAQDFANIQRALLKILPVAKAGSVGGQLLGTAGRVAATGVAAGTTVLAEDVASQALGSDQPIDIPEALAATALGSVFEFAGPFVAREIGLAAKDTGKFVLANLKKIMGRGVGKGGQLTDDAIVALRSMGIDGQSMRPETVKRFARLLKRAQTPEQALRIAKAEGFEVPLTLGQASQEPGQAAIEQGIIKGTSGAEAGGVLRAARSEQQAALGRAAERVQSELGGAAISSPGQGVAQAQNKLFENMLGLKAQVDDAFTAARAKDASILLDGVKNLGRVVGARLRGSGFTSTNAPKVAKTLEQISKLERRFPGNITKVKVSALEQIRQQISVLSRSSDPIEGAAAKQALNQWDDFLHSQMDDALVVGDYGALEAFRGARNLRFNLRQRFEDDEIINRLLDTDFLPDARQVLNLPPQEARKLLFGSSVLGNKKGVTRALQRIKAELGPQSQEWKAIKEEAFLDFLGDLNQSPSGVGFLKRANNAKKFATEAYDSLFSPEEQALIREFGEVVKDATVPPEGAVNFSNTTIVDRIFSRFGAGGNLTRDLLDNFLGGISRGQAIRQAERALQPIVARPPPAQGLLGATAGQVGAEPLGEELPRQLGDRGLGGRSSR